MKTNEASLLRWREATNQLRSRVINIAVGSYSAVLDKSRDFNSLDVQAAERAAEAALVDQVTSTKWISAFSGNSNSREGKQAAIKLSFNVVRPTLRLPTPIPVFEYSPIRIGIAALVGAIVGMMVLSPLTRYLLGMDDVGIFVGAPAGAFLMVLGVWNAARSKWLGTFLKSVFGVAAIAEVWGLFAGRGIVKTVLGRFGGRQAGIKRIIVLVAAIFLIVIAKPQRRFDRSENELNVGKAIDQWLDAAIPYLGLLAGSEPITANEAVLQSMLSQLVQKVLELRSLPPENLSAGNDELLQYVKNMGFETEEQPQKVFNWQIGHKIRYDVFGHVEPGDRVIVEREAVVLQGVVQSKGKVRKMREGD